MSSYDILTLENPPHHGSKEMYFSPIFIFQVRSLKILQPR
jgi:hypothetical protein